MAAVNIETAETPEKFEGSRAESENEETRIAESLKAVQYAYTLFFCLLLVFLLIVHQRIGKAGRQLASLIVLDEAAAKNERLPAEPETTSDS